MNFTLIKMNRIVIFVIILFYSNLCYSQTDTLFWFAAPDVSSNNLVNPSSNFDKPVYLRISSYNQPATVTITQPANPLFIPIIQNIGSNSFVSVDLTAYLTSLELTPPNAILNYGIKVASTANITVYYEVASTYCNCNPEIYTLKGKNALGKAFYIPAQNEFNNNPGYNPRAYNTFNIVASEPNTTVTIVPSNNIVGHQAGIPFQINLEMGQCYSAQASSQSGQFHLQGSKVTSDKPIAITISDDLVTPSWGSCADLMGDQIVPVNVIGTDYIGVKGFLSNNNDRLYIIATQQDTKVFINGNSLPIANLNESQTFSYTFGAVNAVYVHTDKPVYVLHLTGNGCELSNSLLPSIVCTGSEQVTFTRTTNQECYLMLMTKNGNQTGFVLNGMSSLINANSFSVVPGTNNLWVAARLQFSLADIPINVATMVKNTKGVFHLGFMNGNAGGGCRYGYFSSYNTYSPEINPRTFCLGDSSQFQLSDTTMLSTVLWDFGEPGSSGNFSTSRHPKHFFQKAGTYKVMAIYNYECGIDTSYQDIVVNEKPAAIIFGNDKVSCINPVTLTAGDGSCTYLWSNGLTTSTISATSTGDYSVTKTNAFGCSVRDTVKVKINQPQVPIISGAASAESGPSLAVYSTESGMSNYSWNVSSGGRIISGVGTNIIEVTWLTNGSQSVSVTYNDQNGCSSPTASSEPVLVYSLPIPSISGLSAACVGASDIVYTTESGMTGYSWSVSPGGTITSGLSTHSISVKWDSPGNQKVSVNYTDNLGYSAKLPSSKDVVVNTLPVPAISGSSYICSEGSIVIYNTQSAMKNYQWTVSDGGSVISGNQTNSLNVLWNKPGEQYVELNYSDINGCAANVPTRKTLTYNPSQVPDIIGLTAVCQGSTDVTYSTEAAMTDYKWNVSAGGIIQSGSSTNTIFVGWNNVGDQQVRVNYKKPNGCTNLTDGIKNVKVNSLPIPSIGGSLSTCLNSMDNSYTTETGMSDYSWTISSGGELISAKNANAINVKWDNIGSQTVSVNYTDLNGCKANSSSNLHVTVNPLPAPVILGPASVAVESTQLYKTDPLMTGYSWSVSDGGEILTSFGNQVRVKWNFPGDQMVSVNYTNQYGCWALSGQDYNVSVNKLNISATEGFSPNGDGINDFLVFYGLKYYPGSKLIVHNKDGSLVYQSDDYQNDWDGHLMMKGIAVPVKVATGVYYYTLKLGITNQIIRGFVYIAY